MVTLVYQSSHFISAYIPSNVKSQCANVQADRILRWVHISEVTFSDIAAQVGHLELNVFTLSIGTPYLLTILVRKFEIFHSTTS